MFFLSVHEGVRVAHKSGCAVVAAKVQVVFVRKSHNSRIHTQRFVVYDAATVLKDQVLKFLRVRRRVGFYVSKDKNALSDLSGRDRHDTAAVQA